MNSVDPPEAGAQPGTAGRGPSSGRRFARLALGVVAGLLLVFAALIALLLVDANILRKPIASYVSHTLDRPFAINGDLRIRLFRHPRIEVDEVVLGNAAWGSRPVMAKVERAIIGVRLLPLLHGRIELPQVELTRPDVILERNVEGKANWRFGEAAPSKADVGANPPTIDALWIKGGKLVFRDPGAQTDVALAFDSDRSVGDAKAMLEFKGTGSLRDNEFKLSGRAASLLELTQAGKPYKLDVTASAGATRASFDGTLVPLRLESIDGKLQLSGKDLAALYPIIPVPLPWTPPYDISGRFKRDGAKYTLSDLRGRVGSSDVHGKVSVDMKNERPLLVADVTSKRLDQKDLAGFLGTPPPAKGQSRPRDQQQEAQKLEASGKVLSVKPYSLERLRVVDAVVHFKGESILATDIALDSIEVKLKLEAGKLSLTPLDFGVAGGHVTANIELDASKDVIQTRGDATVKNLELKILLPKLKSTPGSAGKLGGRAKFATKGNSPAQMAASANGEIALIMASGKARALALVLTNLDLANAVKYLLRGDPEGPVYCAVTHAAVRDGKVTPDIFVVDSSEEHINGEGDIDLAEETYGLRLVAKSKRASLLALRGPIRIAGTFKHPQVRPEIGPLVLRVGAAVALGTLLTPVAALLPLVDPGGAKGSDCSALIRTAREEVATTPVVAPKNAAPTPRNAGAGTAREQVARTPVVAPKNAVAPSKEPMPASPSAGERSTAADTPKTPAQQIYTR